MALQLKNTGFSLAFIAALALCGCEALKEMSGGGEASDVPWPQQSATLTNQDVIVLQSGIVTAQINQMDKPEDILSINVILLDGEGKTAVDLLFSEKAVYSIQKKPPGEQTAELLGIHKAFAKQLKAIKSSSIPMRLLPNTPMVVGRSSMVGVKEPPFPPYRHSIDKRQHASITPGLTCGPGTQARGREAKPKPQGCGKSTSEPPGEPWRARSVG